MDESVLAEAIQRNNELLKQQIRLARDWKLPLRNGILAGFGGVVGATIVVSLAIWILQPYQGLAPIKAALDRLSFALERDQARR